MDQATINQQSAVQQEQNNTPPPPQYQPQEIILPETNLKDYWNILLRRKWIVISFCLLTTIVTAIISFTMTPLYQATATIVIEGEDSNVLDPGDSSKGMSFDIFENYLQTQMSLILSRSIAGKVFEQLKLDQLPRYQGQVSPVTAWFREKMKQIRGFFVEQPATGDQKPDALQLFLNDVELTRLKGTRAIQISVYNPDAAMAANIANALADRYSRDNMMRRALTFIRNQRMATMNQDYLRLQSKYEFLSNQYGPMHPEMIALRNEIRAMATRIESEKKRQLDPDAPDSPFKNASPGQEEQLLQEILMQIQESSVLSSKQMNNITVADPAVPPTEIAKPKKKLNILIGLLGGLVIGVFLAFFVDYLDDTIKSEEDLKRVIGNVNYLGSIPYDRHVKGFRRISKVDRLVMQRPLSESAEAYRLIRIQLHWHMKKNPHFKDFAVMGSMPDEGKSTVASNIAISLAQLNKKVLLVDADIRRGRLHRTYGTAKKKGLGQYLTEDASFYEIIQKTKIPNLSIVTPGESVMMGAELLSSHKMAEFIQETRENFDMIVYDTPPVTLISDAMVLLSHLHGAILVSRTGLTRSRLVPKALQLMRSANPNVIGIVLNSTQTVENKYYHRYYKD